MRGRPISLVLLMKTTRKSYFPLSTASLTLPSLMSSFALHPNLSASFFDNKIIDIQAGIVNNVANLNNPTVNITHGNLSSFTRTSKIELCKTILQMKSSTWSLDAIPTAFFKDVLDSLLDDVLDIVNCSLELGIFPESHKKASVMPLLKKNNLHPSVLNNYRPISNLPFLGKILENVVLKQ